MIYLKNAQQLDLMRKSGALLYEVLCRLREAIKPGMSTAELDVYAIRAIRPASVPRSTMRWCMAFPPTKPS